MRTIEISADSEAKFEVEGMGILGSTKYICANVNDVANVEGTDGIYRIAKIGGIVS